MCASVLMCVWVCECVCVRVTWAQRLGASGVTVWPSPKIDPIGCYGCQAATVLLLLLLSTPTSAEVSVCAVCVRARPSGAATTSHGDRRNARTRAVRFAGASRAREESAVRCCEQVVVTGGDAGAFGSALHAPRVAAAALPPCRASCAWGDRTFTFTHTKWATCVRENGCAGVGERRWSTLNNNKHRVMLSVRQFCNILSYNWIWDTVYFIFVLDFTHIENISWWNNNLNPGANYFSNLMPK